MRIALTGSTGLIGNALRARLEAVGHEVVALVRSREAQSEGAIFWSPNDDRSETGRSDTAGSDAAGSDAAGSDTDRIEFARLKGVGAVVHLAGENIASGRWNAAQKQRILDSRVQGTGLLARTLARLASPPAVLVSASAIGIYGDRGDEIVDEGSEPGDDFLADVCAQWEAAADPARQAGIRVVHPRFGVVLSPEGGALSKMLTPFRLGLGGVIGSGRQWMSWIALEDAVAAIEHVIENESLDGPVNVVAPGVVTNRDFTKALGRALRRPTIFPMPAFAARLAFGEMADALLLASTRVRSAKLEQSGYQFRHPEIGATLTALLAG